MVHEVEDGCLTSCIVPHNSCFLVERLHSTCESKSRCNCCCMHLKYSKTEGPDCVMTVYVCLGDSIADRFATRCVVTHAIREIWILNR